MFEIMFGFTFIFVISVFIFTFSKIIKESRKNRNSPRLKVEALIVAKREHTSRHRHNINDNLHHYHTSTSYYVTFEVESGDRIELRVPITEYGLLVEGDRGFLHFQGSLYQGFERKRFDGDSKY